VIRLAKVRPFVAAEQPSYLTLVATLFLFRIGKQATKNKLQHAALDFRRVIAHCGQAPQVAR
jgi:hypothetical protein